MNKSVYLGLSILETSKIVMCEIWYDYVKLKYGEKAKLCFMDPDSFIIFVKAEDIYVDIAEDVETRFDISNYELDRPLAKGENKTVISLMRDELGEKIMMEFTELRLETYSYLTDDNDENRKAKSTKKSVVKRKLKFENFKHCLESIQFKNRIN